MMHSKGVIDGLTNLSRLRGNRPFPLSPQWNIVRTQAGLQNRCPLEIKGIKPHAKLEAVLNIGKSLVIK
jgi:hypothetical protein